MAADLAKVKKHKLLSPVLIVRGSISEGIDAQIADGYHRICASYQLDENTDIPCRIVDLKHALSPVSGEGLHVLP
jgi:hypothetical protein